MMRMREHIYRLHSNHLVIHIKQLQVTCLGSRITAHINNALGSRKQDCINHIRMHSGTWRVGYYNIGTTMLIDEIAGKNILHITGKESKVVKTIEFRIYTRINNGILNILDADNLLRLCGDNGAMIGAQGYYEFLAGNLASSDLNAYATMEL